MALLSNITLGSNGLSETNTCRFGNVKKSFIALTPDGQALVQQTRGKITPETTNFNTDAKTSIGYMEICDRCVLSNHAMNLVEDLAL